MLRSIVVVWCLAAALLVIAATAGCGWGGCLNGDDCSAGIGLSQPDMAQHPDLGTQCATSCGTCAADQICFQPSAVAQLPAFCAHQCADDRDCGAGEKCASLFAALEPSVCISAGMPVGCAAPSPTWHCDFPPATCADANTAHVPFSDATDRVCGTAIVHCANGCVAGACR